MRMGIRVPGLYENVKNVPNTVLLLQIHLVNGLRDLLGLPLGPRQRRQQQRRQNGDDGDDYQQLNQRKCP